MTTTTQTAAVGIVRAPSPRTGTSSSSPVRDLHEQSFDNSVGLSARECEILRLVATGLSNQQIAGTIFVGVNTIKTYIRSTYRKLKVESRTQAVVWAFDHGLVEPKRAPGLSSPAATATALGGGRARPTR